MQYLSLDERGRVKEADLKKVFVNPIKYSKYRPTDSAIASLRPAGLASKFGQIVSIY